MKLRDLYEQMILESNKITAYHGTNASFDAFDFSKIGTDRHNMLNGPGFYFTLDPEEAKVYGKFVHEYVLNIANFLTANNPPNISDIQKLVISSPNFDMNIYDWEQTPEKGLKVYLNAMKQEKSNFHAFMAVWRDFYFYDSQDFVENVVKLGYDAAIIKGSEGYGNINEKGHVIVYNPEVIRRVKPLE